MNCVADSGSGISVCTDKGWPCIGVPAMAVGDSGKAIIFRKR